MSFGECMEIRIPRAELDNASYAIPTRVNIWVEGTAWDYFAIVE